MPTSLLTLLRQRPSLIVVVTANARTKTGREIPLLPDEQSDTQVLMCVSLVLQCETACM